MEATKQSWVTKMVLKGLELHRKIDENEELKELERQGFVRGEKKGKHMNVSLKELMQSLRKQYLDCLGAYNSKKISDMMCTIADLRNVAGCVFLKLEEGGDK